MRSFYSTLATGVLVALLAACGGGAASPSPGVPTGAASPGAPVTPTDAASPNTAPPALTPDVTPAVESPVLPTAEPTGDQPPAAVGSECANVPTFDPSAGAAPSFSPDTEREAFFPQQIDGNPVTDVQSFRWIEFVCLFGGQPAVDEMTADAPGDLNVASLSFASAEVTVDGEEVQLAAFRSPDQQGGRLLESLAALITATGRNMGMTDDFENAVVGGKNVMTWTDDDGDRVYVYESGSILFSVDGVTESQAEKIFAALP